MFFAQFVENIGAPGLDTQFPIYLGSAREIPRAYIGAIGLDTHIVLHVATS